MPYGDLAMVLSIIFKRALDRNERSSGVRGAEGIGSSITGVSNGATASEPVSVKMSRRSRSLAMVCARSGAVIGKDQNGTADVTGLTIANGLSL